MRLNQLSRAGAVNPSDLVLIWQADNSQSRVAPFSLMVDAAQQAVYDRIKVPGGLEGIGAAASGANGDITSLTGIKTSRTINDLNLCDATGWFVTTQAASNIPVSEPCLCWHQQGDATKAAQIVVALNTGNVYTRKFAIVSPATQPAWSNYKSQAAIGDISVSNLTGTGATGRTLMAAADAPTARTALGMTTVGSNLVLSSSASGARTVLGSGTVGDQIFTAADGATVRGLIAGTTGAQIMTQGNASGVYSVLGVTALGQTLIKRGAADDMLTDLGATPTGKAFITAADTTAAQTAIGASTVGKALLVATDKAAGRTAIDAMAVDAVPTAAARGGVTQATAIADLTAAPTQSDFNGLLAKLRTVGILAAS